MTKAAKNTPLRKAVKQINIEGLIEHLEGLGADASNILRPIDERRERMQSQMQICISPGIADVIVAILRSLPKQRPGPKKIWSPEIEAIAEMGLFTGKQISVLACQIMAKTGETKGAVRRKLERLQQSPRFKRAMQDSHKYRLTVQVEPYLPYSAAELALILRG